MHMAWLRKHPIPNCCDRRTIWGFYHNYLSQCAGLWRKLCSPRHYDSITKCLTAEMSRQTLLNNQITFLHAGSLPLFCSSSNHSPQLATKLSGLPSQTVSQPMAFWFSCVQQQARRIDHIASIQIICNYPTILDKRNLDTNIHSGETDEANWNTE